MLKMSGYNRAGGSDSFSLCKIMLRLGLTNTIKLKWGQICTEYANRSTNHLYNFFFFLQEPSCNSTIIYIDVNVQHQIRSIKVSCDFICIFTNNLCMLLSEASRLYLYCFAYFTWRLNHCWKIKVNQLSSAFRPIVGGRAMCMYRLGELLFLKR